MGTRTLRPPMPTSPQSRRKRRKEATRSPTVQQRKNLPMETIRRKMQRRKRLERERAVPSASWMRIARSLRIRRQKRHRRKLVETRTSWKMRLGMLRRERFVLGRGRKQQRRTRKQLRRSRTRWCSESTAIESVSVALRDITDRPRIYKIRPALRIFLPAPKCTLKTRPSRGQRKPMSRCATDVVAAERATRFKRAAINGRRDATRHALVTGTTRCVFNICSRQTRFPNK